MSLASHWDDDAAMADEGLDWMGEQTASPEFAQQFEADFDEEKHPRDDRGRWTEAGISDITAEGAAKAVEHTGVRGTPTFTDIAEGAHADKAVLDRVQSLQAEFAAERDSMLRPQNDYEKVLGDLVHDYGVNKLDPAWQEAFDKYGERKVGLALATLQGADAHPDKLKSLLDEAQKLADTHPLLYAPNIGDPLPGGRTTSQLAFALEHDLSVAEYMRAADGAGFYSSSEYGLMNETLREGEVRIHSEEVRADTRKENAAFDRLLAMAPDVVGSNNIRAATGDPGKFYRAFRLWDDDPLVQKLGITKSGVEFVEGKFSFTEKGFISASTHEGFARRWAEDKINVTTASHGGARAGHSKISFVMEWKNAGGAKNVTPFLSLGKTEGEVNYRPGAKITVSKALIVNSQRGDYWYLKAAVKPGKAKK